MEKRLWNKRHRQSFMSRVFACMMAVVMVLGTMTLPANAAGEAATIAGWEFTKDNAIANSNEPIGKTAGTAEGALFSWSEGMNSKGNTASSLGTEKWITPQEGGSWLMTGINAANYENLTFSAKMKSSGTGPKNFRLEYSLDNGTNWTAIAGSEVENGSESKPIQKYDGFALPAELNGKTFSLRIHMTDTVSVNNGTVGPGGTCNIQDVVIAGTASGGEVVPPLNCAVVTANPAAGEVESGTAVTLSSVTEGASIYYKLNDAGEYALYETPIQVTEAMTIRAYAAKEGLENSAETEFAYTVKEVEPDTNFGSQLKAVADKDTFIMYNPANKKVMSATASGTRMAAIDAEVSAENTLDAPNGAAALTAESDEESGFYRLKSAGKYLTSGSTGNSLTMEKTPTEFSLWEIEKADENGGFFVRNANAEYGGNKNQYIEFFSTFTTYGKNSGSKPDAFLMQFYRAEAQSGSVEVDESTVFNIAEWAGNANYETAGVNTEITGDLYKTNDMLDKESVYTAVVNGKPVKPYTKATASGTGSVSYYLGGTGLGSGTDDYVQMAVSSRGYGKMGLSFRLRASNTGAGSFQVQYSTDGKKFKNFTTGSYDFKYTAYNGQGESYEVSKADTIKDGIAKTSLAPANYINFRFDVPKGAENAEKLYIRLVPGDKNAKGDKEPGTGGVLRVDSVVLKGSPAVSDELCGYVTADPAEGEISGGSAVTLTSATEGAEIYYSLNNGEYQKYENPVVIDTLPSTIRTYAKKDGLADSIKVIYQYNAGKVKPVKATPNGGAVKKDTKVILQCDTEGAEIFYSENEGADWVKYEEELVLSQLPKTYLVKATKEGYEDSSVQTLKYTERTSDKYGIFFGQLHSHTNYSDGAGSCEEAFQYGSQKAKNLDFLAVTDHSNSFDNADAASINNGSVSEEWKEGHALADKYTKDGEFVSLYGYEMTWSNGLGHMNTFNSEGFQSRTQTEFATYSTALQNYYKALKTAPDSISQFNHPGTTFGDFSDFAYYDEENDNLITTIEVGNGEGAIGSSGYFPSYEYYQRALDKGWHVAPTNNQDNHKGLWGDANTGRSVVLADSLTRANIYDAMRNYRVYATEDNDLHIYYTLDGYEMGSVLSAGQTGETVTLRAELSDKTDKAIGKVQVITNGGLVLDEKNVAGNEENVEFTVNNQYSYYYLKITEDDGDIAVTAPVWVGEVEAAGINSISTEEVLPVAGEPVKVDLNLYNNENTDMQINSVDFSVGDEIVHSVNLEEAGLTSVPSLGDAVYSFDYLYDKVGSMELNVTVNATLNGVEKVYKSTLKLTYVTPEMVTNVIVDGTHYNDYVTGYYGGNVGNFTKIAGDKNIKVKVVTDKITPEILKDCSLLVISAPAKKTGTANAGDFKPSHFEDEFIAAVKEYTDRGGTLIACGIADYQDSTSGQTATEMNKLLSAIGATTRLNSDEAYDEENNGGQPYRLYLTNYKADSKYLAGAVEGQQYSAYSGCTVNLDKDAVAAGTAEALVTGYDTTYSIDCKDENGNAVAGQPPYIEKGNMVAIGHETLAGGANIFVSGTVFVSDFEVKAELDNAFDLPYLNKTIVDNILDEVTVELPITKIADVRKANMGDVFAVEGYVTAGTSNENTKFFDAIYVQDDTAGITVFPYSELGLEIGTKIRITGYVDAYQGDKEIQIMKYKVLSDEDKNVLPAKQMSAAEAMDYETNGGSLVEVTGKVTRVVTDSAGTGVAQFWLDDGSGTEASIFIDGYILSGTTGKNTLASIVKEGAEITAAGLVYAHPEGESDTPVICLRVRDCDEIRLKNAGGGTGEGNNPGGDTGNGGNNSGGNTGNGGNNAGGNTGNGGNNSNGNAGNNGNKGNAVSTGDDMVNLWMYVAVILCSAGVAGVIFIKRKNGRN